MSEDSQRSQPKNRAPFDNFADAAKRIFNLPKNAVEKVKKAVPKPVGNPRNSRSRTGHK